MELNKYIDHTHLKSASSLEAYEQLTKEALEHRFFSVCVPPNMVNFCKKQLEGSEVKLCSVAAFPWAYNTLESKLFEIQDLYQGGCDEVDTVLSVNRVKSGDWDAVEKEFKAYAEISAGISKDQSLKVIVESGILEEQELQKICEYANAYPVTFLKTSTGFAEKGASLEAVQLMRKNLSPKIKIKASGGIRTKEQAFAYIEAGAERLGLSASVSIMESL